MKNIIILLAIALVCLTSCNKEIIEPNYIEVPEEVTDTTAWYERYANGGTLPTGNSTYTNELIGTTWVLTKMVASFSTSYPNDTIYFVDNVHYTLNNGAERNYQLNSLPSSSNFDLSLYYFSPFGGSNYSANIGKYFIDDEEINNVEFEGTQNSSSTIRAWLKKI